MHLKLLNTYTHLTQHFSLCRARRWAQRHTGTSSRIHTLLSAVHQHTYTHTWLTAMDMVSGASPSPPARLGFCCKMQARGGRTGGYYTSGTWVGWTDWIEMILLVGMMTFYREVQQASTHTHTIATSGWWENRSYFSRMLGCTFVLPCTWHFHGSIIFLNYNYP